MASITARLAKFSLAISSKPWRCRPSSRSIRWATSGSASRSEALWSRLIRTPVDFGDPPSMAAAGKIRRQPGPEDLHAVLRAHEPRRQDQHVGVIVLPGEPGHFGGPRHRRTNAGMAVGGVGHTEPGPTEQDAPLRIVMLHPGRYLVGVVRVVGGFR